MDKVRHSMQITNQELKALMYSFDHSPITRLSKNIPVYPA